jgi:hypothetical protein
MRILDQPALNHTEYLACLAAFSNSLGRNLGETDAYLAKLAGKRKGSHFGWEMALDKARYGALIVLERWKEFNQRFADSLRNTPARAMAEAAAPRCDTAAQALEAAYYSLDQLDEYSELLVQEAMRRLRAVEEIFAEEREAASRASSQFSPESPTLTVVGGPAGPASADKFRSVYDSFLTDLGRR